jgi:hypothetical protein
MVAHRWLLLLLLHTWLLQILHGVRITVWQHTTRHPARCRWPLLLLLWRLVWQQQQL